VASVAWLLALATLLWHQAPAGDDAYYHAVYALETLRGWRDGVVWPTWQPDWNWGTGSFVAAIHPPLTFWIGAVAARVAGEATRGVGLSLVAALAAGAWLLSRRRIAGTPGAAWLLAPYPLLAALTRSTVTEAWGLAWAVPILALGMPPGPRTRGEGRALAVAWALAGLTQHAVGLECAVLLAVGWLAAGLRPFRDLARAAGWSAAGILLAAPSWLGAATSVGEVDARRLVTGELGWRRNLLPAAAPHLRPALVATAAAVILVAGAALLPGRVRGDRGPRALAAAALAGALLATRLAAPAWRLGVLDALQFPWRFLGPATVLALLLVRRLPVGARRPALAVLLLPVLLVRPEVAPPWPPMRPGGSRVALSRAAAGRWGLAPVLPSAVGTWAPGFHPLASLARYRAQRARVRVLEAGFRGRTVRVAAEGGGRVLLPLQWSRRWEVREGARELPARPEAGLVSVEVAPGRHLLRAALRGQPGRRAGAALAAVGLAALAWGGRRRTG